MRITQIEAVPFRLPLRREFRWTGLNVGLGSFVMVRVHTDEGLVGLGEATPLPDWGGDFGRRAGETQESVVTNIAQVLAPVLVGEDAAHIERLLRLMDRVLRGNNYAKCAVDMALHDLLGKAAGLPLYRLLGGAVRPAIPVAHMIGLMEIEDAVAEAAQAAAEGIRAFQVKGGEDAARDVRLIRALREKLGDGIALRLDANQGYRNAKCALQVAVQLDQVGLDYLEQPVIGLTEMADITRAAPMPVIADESCWDPRDALELSNARAADVISIYLAKAGGIARAKDVAAIAAAADLACDVNGSLESGIGNAANVQFALATSAVSLPCVIPISAPRHAQRNTVAGTYYSDDIICDPFPSDGGSLLPLDRPGLGVEIDEEKLEAYRVD